MGIRNQRSLLLHFGRLVSETRAIDALLTVLVDAVSDPAAVGADVVAAARIDESGLRVVAQRGLSADVAALCPPADVVGAEWGRALHAAWDAQGRELRVVSLVSDGRVFGALAAWTLPGGRFDLSQVELIDGFADVVAVAMDRAVEHAALLASNAELRASREALARTEKLRALGEMAAGISHDIKNLLNPLALQLELLRRRIRQGPEAALEVVGRMEQALRAGVEVVERLRAFSRQEVDAAPEPVSLDEVLETVVELCRPRLRLRAGLRIETEPGAPPLVQARRADTVTAAVNLVFNAIDAISGDGCIQVRTGRENSGGFIEVADDGPGMAPEVERRVFEPFFTTKPQGTGMGLAMVYAFVQRYGGQVTLQTGQGQGTRIRLWFPAV